jgi:hypothetical protein
MPRYARLHHFGRVCRFDFAGFVKRNTQGIFAERGFGGERCAGRGDADLEAEVIGCARRAVCGGCVRKEVACEG